MSVETTGLSKSKLQRKDRAQLQIIARAMGGRPEAKARKAEIVELILDLAGIGPDGADQASTGNGADPDPTRTSERAQGETSRDEAPRGHKTQGTTSRDKDRSVEEDTGSDAAPEATARVPQLFGATADEDTGSDAAPEATAPGVGREEPGESRQEAAPQADAGHDQPDGDSDRGNRDNDNRHSDRRDRPRDRNTQDRDNRQDRSRHQDDQPEAGNRRRRRGRGRNDRDRPDEPWTGDPIAISGYLDLREDGYGFLRTKGFHPSREDAYVSVKQVRQFGLRKGDLVTGSCRPATRNEKNPAILQIDSVNEQSPESSKQRSRFEDLTPLFPDQKLRLERDDDPTNMTCRIIDLLSPIGKGQRGLIVSPPKAGKTTIMKEIARSIELNNPEVHLLVLLVDERPEEVTDMRRWLLRGEVAASTFDRPADEHTQVAEMTIERAKRMVERGEDVVIILDGITRLSRAYNLAAPATGRIMSGGIDTGALYPPKKFFGAARNVEEGGSLTILATALVETGSRMDEVIFEEFKGTGNMELRLDRHIAERRIYPAINVDASSTRHEELLFERRKLQQVWKLRRVLNGISSDGNGGGAAGLELLIDRLRTFPNNDAFLEEVAKGPAGV